jgi:peptidoglycan/xylan/chitin deacetylase (PgdA/CDA1 family)
MVPPYYSSLGPFRELFQTGRPVLTYHHVGQRQRGARIKGLYVRERLFERQLSELHAAGFSSPRMDDILSNPKDAASTPPLSIWLTFDDGFQDIFDNALPLLQKYRARGIVFLVAKLIGKTNEWQQRQGDVVEPLMNEAQVQAWLAAGQQIGSHTLTHPRLTQLSQAAAREEIFDSKKSLEDLFGVHIEHFCYPYGDWNEAVRDLVRDAGYRTACTTNNGVNTLGAAPFELKRLTARYPSRSVKTLWSRWGRMFGPK